MKIKDIYSFLDGIAPFSTQMEYDNAGLLIGDMEQEITKCVVALDVTVGAIEYAKSVGANLIISHHPVIFSGVKAISSDDLLYSLIKNGISVISAHTNLDMAPGGVNDCLANAIGLKKVQAVIECGSVYEARTGEVEELSLIDFVKHLKSTLGGSIKYVGQKNVKRVGVCSGSGADLLEQMAANGIDTFVTADVKHNYFILADTLGINLIDAGHFNTEDVVVEPLCEKLQEKFLSEEFLPYHLSIIKSI